jgi:hypothetical protein
VAVYVAVLGIIATLVGVMFNSLHGDIADERKRIDSLEKQVGDAHAENVRLTGELDTWKATEKQISAWALRSFFQNCTAMNWKPDYSGKTCNPGGPPNPSPQGFRYEDPFQ